MEQPIIEVKNISKKYDIAHMRGGYVSLRDVIANVFKNPFSFLAHKAKRAVGLEKKEEFWALKNVSFNVHRGEVIGVIGANGAGKSTLLKILSQITPPTEGEVILRGRVGSLLEVGTGFHPELTGRENIFLNGAILGMKKKEIVAKFDEIVAFAGVDKFLDTPVKHYSSGMYVRLAFSVAAHMEPDILMIDEVLAVGDAEFQRKCLGKMDEITKKDGRTILFVSHNMAAVRQICPVSILLKHGKMVRIGKTEDVIDDYLKESQRVITGADSGKNPSKEARIKSISIKDSSGSVNGTLSANKPFFIETEYELFSDLPAHVVVKISKFEIPNTHLLVSMSTDNGQKMPKGPGVYKATVKIEPVLNTGTYSLLVGISTDVRNYLDKIIQHNAISIHGGDSFAFPVESTYRPDSAILMPFEWRVTKI